MADPNAREQAGRRRIVERISADDQNVQHHAKTPHLRGERGILRRPGADDLRAHIRRTSEAVAQSVVTVYLSEHRRVLQLEVEAQLRSIKEINYFIFPLQILLVRETDHSSLSLSLVILYIIYYIIIVI